MHGIGRVNNNWSGNICDCINPFIAIIMVMLVKAVDDAVH